jgi:uncharacterized membrane protein YdbT with pleckstrin-like domain
MAAELKLLEVSPSVKNWPVLIGIGMLLMGTAALGVILLILSLQTALLVAACGVGLTVWPALCASNTEYIITNLRVVHRAGFFKKTERQIDVPQIREIRVVRSSVQKTLGIGDLELVAEVGVFKLAGVEDPDLIRDKIKSLA